MFIPLRTNRPPRRKPIVTELLILLNVAVYLLGLMAQFFGYFEREALIEFGQLFRNNFHPWQLITYQFLHDPHSIFHLGFNMLFLWIFGAAVEDRLGRISFLGFYLIGGAVAGAAHLMISHNPVIGASGAVAGVTGAFLALFPRSRIMLLVVFFIIGVYSIPALWFIAFYFVIDVLSQTGALVFGSGESGGGVAYMAHIAGYIYGFALAFTLLAVGIVKREEFDVFYLFKQWRRRSAFRAASRGAAAGLWADAPADTEQRLARKSQRERPLTESERKHMADRAEIRRLAQDHQLPEAASIYRAMLDGSPDAVLAEPLQLDLANQLQAEGDTARAARAYELLLKHYPACPTGTEVRLILALLYARKLRNPGRAKELLVEAKPRLKNEGQKSLAAELLSEVGERER